MLTKLTTRNFKRFGVAEIELGNPVIFIGPNDSGKTTALQALAVWDVGLKRWNEKRAGKKAPEKRSGVTINRRDLIAVPVPKANLLWRDLHVRDVKQIDGKQQTKNVFIDIVVEGVSKGRAWECGLEFYYANEESFYCRPLRLSDDKNADRMKIPAEAAEVNVAFLPPMSGLAGNETRLDPGAISVCLGEGRTAEVLRNLCYQIRSSERDGIESWTNLCKEIERLFGVKLQEPKYVAERGEITMSYIDRSKVCLDLSSAGRGLQQTLLLLAYLTVNPSSVLLIDEPDSHLEILRQRQIYELMSQVAREQGSQVIAASHSEVVLNEAAGRDVVVAFVGKPHRIDDRGHQILKALKEIGFDQFYQAEQTGWVLYLEGSTDLSILLAFAKTLDHPAAAVLDRPFARYVFNHPPKARDHFYGLREGKPDLIGIAVFDHLDKPLKDQQELVEIMWSRREIENYLCSREVLLAWTRAEATENAAGPLFAPKWLEVMEETIAEVEAAMDTLGKGSPWSDDAKVTDDFLDPLFRKFFQKLNLPNLLGKTHYHRLADYVEKDRIDPEIVSVLDKIVQVSKLARPA
ncbi:MAG: AAA family ATPase [Candidatus Nealsonbacteria bacterium]|nr:AAA family ATPase [Candidatus Nealsonbacteria bacterium]